MGQIEQVIGGGVFRRMGGRIGRVFVAAVSCNVLRLMWFSSMCQWKKERVVALTSGVPCGGRMWINRGGETRR